MKDNFYNKVNFILLLFFIIISKMNNGWVVLEQGPTKRSKYLEGGRKVRKSSFKYFLFGRIRTLTF